MHACGYESPCRFLASYILFLVAIVTLYCRVGNSDYADHPFSSHCIATFSCVSNDCEPNTAEAKFLPEGDTPPGSQTSSITG